jgi:hypothetical protein
MLDQLTLAIVLLLLFCNAPSGGRKEGKGRKERKEVN